MKIPRCAGGLVGVGILLTLVACQTTSKTSSPAPETESAPVVAAAPFGFVPRSYQAPIAAGEVRYRMLFAPESHAIWITDEVNQLKLDNDLSEGIEVDDSTRLTANVVDARFVVIECRLESAFADSSVAYDVIGLRNVEVYLETPSGERVFPVQRIMAPQADESQQGALVQFARTTLLVFPKDGVGRSSSPLSTAPAVRLVLDGFHSKFYFEWHNAGEPGLVESVEAGEGTSGSAALNAIRTGYTSLYSLLSPLQRIVD